MRKSVIRRSIDTLRDDELLALLGIARLLRAQSYTITNHAFEEYKNLCRTYSVNPHGVASFRKHIKQFIHLDLIQRKKTTHEKFLEISLVDIPCTKLFGLVNERLETKLHSKKRMYEEIYA